MGAAVAKSQDGRALALMASVSRFRSSVRLRLLHPAAARTCAISPSIATAAQPPRNLRELAHPGDTLFVWGFRPDIFIYSGLPAGTRFLESQPISGVLADRHLFSNAASRARIHRAQSRRTDQPHARPGSSTASAPTTPRSRSTASRISRRGSRNIRRSARTGFSILYRLR